MERPYPVLPPPKQKKPICKTCPIPTSFKQPPSTFNKRERFSWGANLVGPNCQPIQNSS
uniref:Uncharacterized protein n=1 Tax=viral metagenome TaxID=1070528 RepID=A0A6C0I5U3_9ZZZZ